MVNVNKGNDAAEQKIAELEREVQGTQEMLAFVLKAVGEPVVVDKQEIKDGLGNVQIRIDDDPNAGVFVFTVVEEELD